MLQPWPAELRAKEVRGYLSRPGGNDGRGNGQAGHNACRQARDEETRRLSAKHRGLEGVHGPGEMNESGTVGERLD